MIKNSLERILLFSLISLLTVLTVNARADKLYLKNGSVIEGIIKQEDPRSVEFDVGIGSVKFIRTEIERIEKSSSAEISLLRQKWLEKKIKDEEKRKAWLAQEKLKKEQAPKEVRFSKESGHIIAKVLLNKKIEVTLIVDTGASAILLSKSVGDKLGILKDKTGKDNPLVDITLADGRKSQARYIVLQNVKVQDAEANDVEAAVLLDDKANIAYDGLLGMTFLNRFNFKFDNKQEKLILEKIR